MKNFQELISIADINKEILPFGFEAKLQNPATENQILQLRTLIKHPLSPELEDFYRSAGSVMMRRLPDTEEDDIDHDYDGEEDADPFEEQIGCIRPTLIPSVAMLLQELQEKKHYMKLYSTGIIDWLRYQWDNDRPEFEKEPSDVLAKLNATYTGLGLRRFGHDSARHLFIDHNGRCGFVDYHQDAYDKLWDEYLTPMQNKSPANLSLEMAITQLLLNQEPPYEF
jgi:hypothetical protein